MWAAIFHTVYSLHFILDVSVSQSQSASRIMKHVLLEDVQTYERQGGD